MNWGESVRTNCGYEVRGLFWDGEYWRGYYKSASRWWPGTWRPDGQFWIKLEGLDLVKNE